MTRHNHLSKTEHILSLTDHEVAYIMELLQMGPPRKTRKAEEIHDRLLKACVELLKPILSP